jgi:murein DD-endopeptidase MepM/ murein hydrolase activator NlpD
MNATRTRRQIIGSAIGLAGVVAAARLTGAASAGSSVTEIRSAASATQQAQRLWPPGRLLFPVQLPGDIVLLDNFGSQRLFGSGSHQGIDIGRRDVQPEHALVACIDGVIDAQTILGGNEGNSWVIIDAAGDRYRYHHLESFAPDLVVGSPVTRGQVIGAMGSTGNPSSPHLHFEVRRGPNRTPVDPVPFLGLPLLGVTVI